jgi:Flp pilus assembly protein TadG
MKSIRKVWHRLHRSADCLLRDCRGVASIEFVMIVPFMLVAFFGTVEFCSAVAVDRKVTLIARTVSDLTSQAATSVDTTYLQNVFTASISIMTPYSPTPIKAQVSEIYVDSKGKATVQWSQAAVINASSTQATLVGSSRAKGDNVTTVVPTSLLVKQTYIIFSEVSYQYVPTIGYIMAKTGIGLNDVSYNRPRQSTCIVYNGQPLLSAGSCPLG